MRLGAWKKYAIGAAGTLALAALVLFVVSAVPAATPPEPAVGPMAGMVHARGSQPATGTSGDLLWHGGPVLNDVQVTPIYWGKSWTASDPKISRLGQFYGGVGGGSRYALTNSEYTGSGGSLAAAGVTAMPSAAFAPFPSAWPDAVSGICAHALLFEGRHEIGTRAGAVAVARDIRASTARRLDRIRALQAPPLQPSLSTQWLDLEQRLADVYASSYVRIYDAIAAAITPNQRARLPRVLDRLVHAPDALRDSAASLEGRLHVPDCTGGG